MKKEINKKTLFYILILISAVLILAFIIEHKFGHEPCKLCIYERVPYFISLLLITKIIFTNGYEKITLFILSLVFIFSSILAFYHFGIEQGFFNESSVCASGNLSEILTKEELLKQIKQNNVGCKNVSFRILGFSLATINTIFSICLSAIFFRLFINYEKNQ